MGGVWVVGVVGVRPCLGSNAKTLSAIFDVHLGRGFELNWA